MPEETVLSATPCSTVLKSSLLNTHSPFLASTFYDLKDFPQRTVCSIYEVMQILPQTPVLFWSLDLDLTMPLS